MSASPFVDTNVLVYAASSTEPAKTAFARALLRTGIVISPQVVFECLNVFVRKWKLTVVQSIESVQEVTLNAQLATEDNRVVAKALELFRSGAFQPYDSKIVATALTAGCTTLYSEDMQDGLVVEGTLTIVNPFRGL